MKIKKYIGSTMPEVMQVVRQEMGESAVILNSREIRSKGIKGLFGKKNIEIIAGIDPMPVAASEKRYMKDKNRSVEQQPTQTPRAQSYPSPTQVSQYPKPVEETLLRLQGEGLNNDSLGELKGHLLKTYYLKDEGISVSEMITVAKDFYQERLDSSPANKSTVDVKRIFLFGPTGVGKTTTIAKLSALAKMKEKKKIGLITLDTYRIAAIEQLKTYAQILDVPIEVAYSKEDLEASTEKFSEMDLVLIDTAGRNFLKETYIKNIQDTIDFKPTDELMCVLSLTTKESDMQAVYDQFLKLSIRDVIFTKADESDNYGQIYNIWKTKPFNVRYITTGQDVPDDIIPANNEILSEMIVGEKKW